MTISIVRKLSQLNPPVGVKFENEGFFSLDNTSEMILTVLAAAAQEESKTKSNSMNWSLEKRFDNGQFLTPVLLGYDHDEDGNLVINQEEALTVRLIYYTFLAGFPLSEIAEILMELQRSTKKGNLTWSGSSVRAILTNERYCGNVLMELCQPLGEESALAFLFHKVQNDFVTLCLDDVEPLNHMSFTDVMVSLYD